MQRKKLVFFFLLLSFTEPGELYLITLEFAKCIY